MVASLFAQHTSLYYPGNEFVNGRVGAFWDLQNTWRTRLFQDTAMTIPVTATGQPVKACVADIGGSTWDLIADTDPHRPTFRISDNGLVYIDCAVGTGLYSRGVQSLVMPAYYCAGLQHIDNSTVRVALGMCKSDGSNFYFGNQTLGEFSGDITGATPSLVRARKTAVTPPFAAPPSVVDVFDALQSGGSLSVRQNNGTFAETPMATAWVDGDTVASMTVVLNASGQNSGTKIPSFNTDATTRFYGGMMLMGAAPLNRSGNVKYFHSKFDSSFAPRASDIVVTFNSDSTADNQLNTTVFMEGIYSVALNDFVTAHTEASVYYVEWSRQADQLSGPQRLSTGSTDLRIYVYNFGVSGSDPYYFLGERWGRSFAALPHVDFHITNHAANLVVPASPTVVDTAGYLRRGPFLSFSDKLRQYFPHTPQAYVNGNEVNIAGNTTVDAVNAAIAAVVASYGDSTQVIDNKAAFDAAGNLSSLFQTDHVHYTASGVAVWRGAVGPVALTMLAAAIAKTPGTVSAPAISAAKVSTSIVPNSHFTSFTGAVPTGWTVAGTATMAQSVEQIDYLKGDTKSVKLTGTGSATISFDLTPYRGQAITFYTRMYVVGGSDLYTGELQFTCDGSTGDANHPGNSWIDALYAKPVDGWIDHTLCTKPIPVTTTTGTLTIPAGLSGVTGTVYIGRVVCTTGSLPRDIV